MGGVEICIFMDYVTDQLHNILSLGQCFPKQRWFPRPTAIDRVPKQHRESLLRIEDGRAARNTLDRGIESNRNTGDASARAAQRRIHDWGEIKIRHYELMGFP